MLASKVLCSSDLNKAGTLTAGGCLGIPNSTDTLTSLMSSVAPTSGVRAGAVLYRGGIRRFGSRNGSKFLRFQLGGCVSYLDRVDLTMVRNAAVERPA